MYVRGSFFKVDAIALGARDVFRIGLCHAFFLLRQDEDLAEKTENRSPRTLMIT